MQDISYPEIDEIFLNMKETVYCFTLALKKYHLFMFLKTKDVTKESQYSIKIKYILFIHFPEEDIFGIQQDTKTSTTYLHHTQH